MGGSVWGHETEADRRYLQALEARLDVKASPASDILEAAILYLEPFHREADAIAILRQLVQREPDNEGAVIWLSYVCGYYVDVCSDLAALEETRKMLEAIIARQEKFKGAAYLLLARAHRDILFMRGDHDARADMSLLCKSVACEPDWVFNHADLAYGYWIKRDKELASREAGVAVRNVWDPAPQMTICRKNYECFITGRACERDVLVRTFKEMGLLKL